MSSYAIDAARRHPRATAIVGVTVAVVLANAVVQGDARRALLYLGVVSLSVAAIDVVLGREAPSPTGVRSPGWESAWLAGAYVLGFAWLFARFVLDFRPAPGLLRLGWLVVLIAFVFQAGPAAFLLARRYRLGDLGLRLAGLQAAPLVILLFGSSALVFTPGHATWRMAFEEAGGSWLAVVQTALLAAVPEEFFRFAWQTRLGAWLKSPAVGWLVAAFVWAGLHAPKDWDDTHAVGSTVMGVINIVPLGLLWGYLTHRTRSILPSIALHATNIWGLQNLL